MSVLVWQAIRLHIPARTSPVKLSGNFSAGQMLLADLHRPRVGIRWHTPPGKKIDAEKFTRGEMIGEVGKLAAEEAVAVPMPSTWQGARMYLDPEPPGRDVFVGYSSISNRILVVIHHAHRRERLLQDQLLPTLRDVAEDSPRPWSVFDLSLKTPPEFAMEKATLNAGDLSLAFADGKRTLMIRQISLAEVALARKPLAEWLVSHQKLSARRYKPLDEVKETKIKSATGQTLTAMQRTLNRRRRFFFAWNIAPSLSAAVAHDVQRDRIVLVQASESQVALDVLASAGWAVGLQA